MRVGYPTQDTTAQHNVNVLSFLIEGERTMMVIAKDRIYLGYWLNVPQIFGIIRRRTDRRR